MSAVADDVIFLPVEFEGASIDAGSPPSPHQPALAAPLAAQRVDIALSDGRRILVEGTTALAAVVAMVEGLSV